MSGITEKSCGKCRYFEATFRVADKPLAGTTLTRIGGIYGWCRYFEEAEHKAPHWVGSDPETPLLQEGAGNWCQTFEPMDGERDDDIDDAEYV